MSNNDEIPFYKPDIDEEEIQAVSEVLRSGWLTMGPKVIDFENGFGKYIGSTNNISTNSCTASLFLSLFALGIGRGDEVITTPFTFAATVNTIIHCGATPVFADIIEDTCNIDTERVAELVTDKTKAIVPVHFAGLSVDMDPLLKLQKHNSLSIVEDCAHSIGTRYRGKHVGTLGDTGCFSFYATKNLSTGEGGMISTESVTLADSLRQLRLHGLSRDAWKRYGPSGSWRYDVKVPGYKCNMMDLQASIGLVQLKKLERMNKQKAALARLYTENLNEVSRITTPPHDNERSWHLYTIQLAGGYEARNKLMQALSKQHIGFSVHFQSLHLQEAYSSLGYKTGDLPISEKVSSSIISLPLFPQMKPNQVYRVCSIIKDVMHQPI